LRAHHVGEKGEKRKVPEGSALKKEEGLLHLGEHEAAVKVQQGGEIQPSDGGKGDPQFKKNEKRGNRPRAKDYFSGRRVGLAQKKKPRHSKGGRREGKNRSPKKRAWGKRRRPCFSGG